MLGRLRSWLYSPDPKQSEDDELEGISYEQTAFERMKGTFDRSIGRRADYSDFSFDLEPEENSIRVTNDSYGDEADEHSYLVRIRNGLPAECECPSDKYSPDDEPCKHRIGVALSQPLIDAIDEIET